MRISDWSSDVCSSDLVDVEDDARTADLLQIGDRIAQFAFEHPLHARVDRQRERLTARRGVGQPILEGALDPGDALSLGIGETEDMRRAGGLRIKARLFAGAFAADLAATVHRRARSQARRAGNEGVSRCRYGWGRYNIKKKQ